MNGDAFDQLRETVHAGGAERGFELLIEKLRAEKNYARLFDALTMRKRRELGLPLIQHGEIGGSEEIRRAYEEAMVAAAREVGSLFLADGEIARAWPYFRALGDPGPVAAAIDNEHAREGIEPVIEIAFMEGVNPRKGLELIVAHHGICRAITCVDQSPNEKDRPELIRLLVRALYDELADSLSIVIEKNEGAAPATRRVAELISGRDWLFGEYAYYVDTSHLISILRMTFELDDRPSLELAIEMAEYGKRLSSQFHFRGDPPFENIYEDHAIYFRTLLGEDVEAGIAHFREKAERGSGVEVYIDLLARLNRYPEAVDAALRFTPDAPNVYELCQRAGDFARLMQVARERDDLLTYIAAAAQAERPTVE